MSDEKKTLKREKTLEVPSLTRRLSDVGIHRKLSTGLRELRRPKKREAIRIVKV